MLQEPCLDVWSCLGHFLAHQHGCRLRAVSKRNSQALEPAFKLAQRLVQKIQRWWRATMRAHAWRVWRQTPLHARHRAEGCCVCRRALDVPVRFDLRSTFEEEGETFVVPHFFCWACVHRRVGEMRDVVAPHVSVQAISWMMTEDQTQAFVECCWQTQPAPPLPPPRA